MKPVLGDFIGSTITFATSSTVTLQLSRISAPSYSVLPSVVKTDGHRDRSLSVTIVPPFLSMSVY
jgi:hypothetical protein